LRTQVIDFFTFATELVCRCERSWNKIWYSHIHTYSKIIRNMHTNRLNHKHL